MVLDGTGTSLRKHLDVGSTRRVITDLVTIKASANATGDAVTVMEIETPPGGGMPPHTQRYEDESIYVLEGTYTLLIGDEQYDVSEGDARFIGRGTRHGFVNAGSGTSRMLVHLTPGGIHEQFIAEIGDSPDRSMWKSDMRRIVSIAPAYGVEFDTEGTSIDGSM